MKSQNPESRSQKPKILSAWDRWWTRPTPPHALALTRIALGCFLLFYFGLYLPHVRVLFSNEGVAMPLYEGRAPAWALPFIMPPSPLVAEILFLLILLSFLGIALGAFLRTSTLVASLLSMYFWQLQLHLFPASYNRILFFCLLVLLPGGADRTFSLAMLWKHGSVFVWKSVSILPQRLLSVQITFTFLGVGWQKLWLPSWQTGEILPYSFISRWGTPFAFWFVRLPLTLRFYDNLLFVVKFFEFVVPFGLWIPATRKYAIGGIAVFLILIASFLSIWWFLFIIPSCILFEDPEVVLSLCRKRFRGRIPQTSVG